MTSFLYQITLAGLQSSVLQGFRLKWELIPGGTSIAKNTYMSREVYYAWIICSYLGYMVPKNYHVGPQTANKRRKTHAYLIQGDTGVLWVSLSVCVGCMRVRKADLLSKICSLSKCYEIKRGYVCIPYY